MMAESSKALGFVLFDSQWRVLSANTEALAAINHRTTDSDAAETELREFAAQVALRMQAAAPPKTFTYAGFTCTVLRFSCAYGNTGETANAALIGRTQDNSSFVQSLGQRFRLTPRETEAHAHCLKGYSAKEMAQHMGISASTAKSFMRMISTKAGVTSRAEILSKVLDLMCEASLTCPFRVRRS